MHTIDALRRSAVAIEPERTIREAAAIMSHSGVGSLAVVDGTALVGIVTDRDLVRRALALNVPSDARADSVMSSPVATIDATDDVHAAFAVFRKSGVRRLAVVNEDRFVGMLTIDDLLVSLASDMADLVGPVGGEILAPHHDAPLPVLKDDSS